MGRTCDRRGRGGSNLCFPLVETIPYGISMVQADQVSDAGGRQPKRSASSQDPQVPPARHASIVASELRVGMTMLIGTTGPTSVPDFGGCVRGKMTMCQESTRALPRVTENRDRIERRQPQGGRGDRLTLSSWEWPVALC
jgi:hypothetical protein